jgi:hypothetical protein
MSTHYWKEETRPMIRHIVKPLTMAVAVVALVSSLAQATPDEMQKTPTPVAPPASMSGTVTAVDTHGTATVHTADGKNHKLKHHSWQVGDKVECTMKSGKTSCTKAS